MTSKLRIDLSHKTERVRFSGTPPLNYLPVMHVFFHNVFLGRKTLKFEADTLFYTNLNSNCESLPNMSHTQKGQFGEICVTKLRRKNSVT